MNNSKLLLQKFNDEAKKNWVATFNAYEIELQPNGRYHDIPDYISKIMDNISRVAAILHYVNERPGNIDIDTLQEAVYYCTYFAEQFKQIIVGTPEVYTDSLELTDWFYRRFNGSCTIIRKNFIRQNGPYKLRSKGRLDHALDLLCTQGRISIFADNKDTLWVNLCPNQLPNVPPVTTARNRPSNRTKQGN